MKGKRNIIIMGVLVIICLLSMSWAVFATRNQPETIANNLPPIPADAIASTDFAQHYPRQYESMMRTREVDTVESYKSTGGEYGGAYHLSSHFERQPYLPVLFNGYGFAVEYNEDRGHEYTLEDVRAITTVRTKAGASCTYCKSSSIPGLLEKYGDSFYTLSFDEAYEQLEHPISCSDCHDPETMDLRITRPALIEAFERQGRDITKASKQEMRTLVCAQCHVEYYFAPETKIVTFPWDNGEKAEDVYQYYQTIGFKDWSHTDTNTPMLKAQHPDYELFLNSTHYAAGLACADCHMPYMKEGTVKYSSHWLTSPLKTMEQSCLTCHRESAEDLVARVRYTQDKSWELQDLAAKTLEQTIADIAYAQSQPNVDEALLEEARQLHRQGQFYWDWIAAENSRGFHNPQDTMNTLGKAIDLGHKASAKALAACQ